MCFFSGEVEEEELTFKTRAEELLFHCYFLFFIAFFGPFFSLFSIGGSGSFLFGGESALS